MHAAHVTLACLRRASGLFVRESTSECNCGRRLTYWRRDWRSGVEFWYSVCQSTALVGAGKIHFCVRKSRFVDTRLFSKPIISFE
jgi:hypothetical protein